MSIEAAKALHALTKKELTLGTMLWSIRMCDDKTQLEFAKILGVSNRYLCDLESGRRTASPTMAKKFAEKLGYLPEQFVELAVQDMLNQHQLNMKVHIEKAA